MGYIVQVGERVFETPTIDDDQTLAKAIGEGLRNKPTSTATVRGTDPQIYIGGVARLIGSQISQVLTPEIPHTRETKDHQNRLGVSDKTIIVFKRSN